MGKRKSADILKNLKEKHNFTVEFEEEKKGYIMSADNRYINACLKAYSDFTDDDKPKKYINAGATYARKLPCAAHLALYRSLKYQDTSALLKRAICLLLFRVMICTDARRRNGDYYETLNDIIHYTKSVDFVILNLECPSGNEEDYMPIKKASPNLICSKNCISF